MYQPFNSTNVHRNIKSYTIASLIVNCIFGLIVFIILSMIALALLPLYLPLDHFIPGNLNNNNITPTRSNTSTVFIDEKTWPTVGKMFENLLNAKLNNIQFTNLSDIRIVDTISDLSSKSIALPSTWCDISGCLRVYGQMKFPLDCSFACQLHKIIQIEQLNLIEPAIQMEMNSTLNVKYTIELDAFTVVVSENAANGDQVKMFLLYNLMENEDRAMSSISVSVDNSSLVNITRLVTNSIIQSHMNIDKFNVIQADVNLDLSILNVTVLFQFDIQCLSDCQEEEVNKLRNTILILLDPIGLIYNGQSYVHNVSLTAVFLEISTTESTSTPDESTMETTSIPIMDLMESIFEVIYKLQPFDLIIEGDLDVGPITDGVTLDDLADMMQTTVGNYSNITVLVLNATIEIAEENSTTETPLSHSINYILHLIVYYIYPRTCDECIAISNNAIYNPPEFNKLIQIRNATLVDIPSPMLVIDLTPYSTVTSLSSTDTSSISTVQFPTTDSNEEYSSDTQSSTETTTSSTLSYLTTNQYQNTDHTNPILLSTEHTTLHATDHSSHQTTEHTSHSTTEYTSHHTSTHTTTYSHTT